MIAVPAGWEGCALVVPAGGGGRRMRAADPAVTDKLAAALGASTVLGELLARVPPGVAVAVVGPVRAVPAGVLLAREEPPGGGPVAAVAAGVAALADAGRLAGSGPGPHGAEPCRSDRHGSAPCGPAAGADVVVVCAGDAPWSPLAVPALVAALRAADPVAAVAVAVDAGGAVQPLLAAHRVPALLARLAAGGDVAGRPARWLLGADPVPVPVPPGAADDVDTPEQLAAARERAARG